MKTSTLCWLFIFAVILGLLYVTSHQLYPKAFPLPGGDVTYEQPLYERSAP